jgi:hypothetical protein
MPNSSQFITAWFRKKLFLLLILFLNPGIDPFQYFALDSGFILLLFVRQVLSPRRRRKWSPGPHRARHGYGCNKTLHKPSTLQARPSHSQASPRPAFPRPRSHGVPGSVLPRPRNELPRNELPSLPRHLGSPQPPDATKGTKGPDSPSRPQRRASDLRLSDAGVPPKYLVQVGAHTLGKAICCKQNVRFTCIHHHHPIQKVIIISSTPIIESSSRHSNDSMYLLTGCHGVLGWFKF